MFMKIVNYDSGRALAVARFVKCLNILFTFLTLFIIIMPFSPLMFCLVICTCFGLGVHYYVWLFYHFSRLETQASFQDFTKDFYE